MLLGCLVDCGWPRATAALHTIESLKLPPDQWQVRVSKGAQRPAGRDAGDRAHAAGRLTTAAWPTSPRSSTPRRCRESSGNARSAIFTRLAHAEANVHGSSPDKIHFHEVGAVDAIIDIVASVNGLHELDVQRLYASPVPLGEGWVNSAHGRLPVPAPATLELLAAAKAPDAPLARRRRT